MLVSPKWSAYNMHPNAITRSPGRRKAPQNQRRLVCSFARPITCEMQRKSPVTSEPCWRTGDALTVLIALRAVVDALGQFDLPAARTTQVGLLRPPAGLVELIIVHLL